MKIKVNPRKNEIGKFVDENSLITFLPRARAGIEEFM